MEVVPEDDKFFLIQEAELLNEMEFPFDGFGVVAGVGENDVVRGALEEGPGVITVEIGFEVADGIGTGGEAVGLDGRRGFARRFLKLFFEDGVDFFDIEAGEGGVFKIIHDLEEILSEGDADFEVVDGVGKEGGEEEENVGIGEVFFDGVDVGDVFGNAVFFMRFFKNFLGDPRRNRSEGLAVGFSYEGKVGAVTGEVVEEAIVFAGEVVEFGDGRSAEAEGRDEGIDDFSSGAGHSWVFFRSEREGVRVFLRFRYPRRWFV